MMPGFLASGEEEFNLRSVMRLDCSELLCNKVLLNYKREKASDTDIKGVTDLHESSLPKTSPQSVLSTGKG